MEKSISIYNGLLYCKSNTIIFTIFLFSLTAIILILTSFYSRKIKNLDSNKELDSYNFQIINSINKTAEQFKIIEYPLIILFVITGGTFLMSSSDLVSIFLSIELQSYGLYLLCSIYRNSELSTNAGLTYFLLGGLSSCIILLGQSLLYINSGSTYLDSIYIINSIFTNDINLSENVNGSLLDQYYIQLSMVILSTGFLFKVSAAPFHFWSPDVYDAIPTVVTTFVAIIAKISIFIFLLDLVYYTSITSLTFTWKTILLVSSLLSLIIGSVLGLTQSRIKRLFAYSTISHVGFILLALSINSIESIQAFYFYIIQYSMTNLNAFLILISMGYTFLLLTNNKINYNTFTSQALTNDVTQTNSESKTINKKESISPIQFIHEIKGFFFINPILTISFAITLFSFIGVPPLMGFFAKQMILSAALDNGYVFMSLVAILTSVISAVYYLAIIKELFFEKPNFQILPLNNNNSIQWNYNNLSLSSSLTSSISVITLILISFIFIPKEFMYLTSILSII
jgi:NADH-ubiquinone oxidoreductase chain 2